MAFNSSLFPHWNEITSVRQSALFTASIYLKSCSNTWQCRTPPQCSSSWPRAHLPRRYHARWQSGQPQGWMYFIQLLNMISEAVIWDDDHQYKFRTIIVLIDHFLKCYLAPAQHWNACLLKVARSRKYALPEILSTWNEIKIMWRRSLPFQLNLPNACLPTFVHRSIPWKQASGIVIEYMTE